MSVVIGICLAMLAAAAALALVRVLVSEGVDDRIVGSDVLLTVITTALAVGAVAERSGLLLNLHVVSALLGFTGTVAVARFIERRGT